MNHRSLFVFFQKLICNFIEGLPVFRVQLSQHGHKGFAEFIIAFVGLNGEAHDLFLTGALLEGLALTGAEPDLITAELPADVGDGAVAGIACA